MIAIKRVYDTAQNSDGYRILIDRIWPRGLSKEAAKIDVWMRDIAPSNDLRKWFSHDVKKWPEFVEKYKNELQSKNELVKELLQMEREHEKITLLFGAKDTEHNQAVVIKQYIHK